MKAKCIKPLCVDGYQFEEGKEYDIEWKEFVRECDDHDPVLARGHHVRHIQYAVKYNFFLPKMFSKEDEKVSATLYLDDRQYCEHEDYTAPAIDPIGWTSGGPLLCFDDFFKEVHDVSGRMWSPKPDPSLLKPAKMSPWVKQEMEKTIESILGDKKDQPVILPSGLPRRMDYEHWKQQMLGYPRPPREIRIPLSDMQELTRWLEQFAHVAIDPEEMKEHGIIIKAKED